MVESTGKQATYETKRKGEPEPTRLTYTYEQAVAAKFVHGKEGKIKNQWLEPTALLRWRCAVALARIVYPDTVTGLYAVEEFDRD